MISLLLIYKQVNRIDNVKAESKPKKRNTFVMLSTSIAIYWSVLDPETK